MQTFFFFLQHALPFSQGHGPNHLETRGPSISEFQEKLALPRLPIDRSSNYI